MPINYTINFEVLAPVDTIDVKYKINSASTYTTLNSISGATFPYFGSETLTVPDGNEHIVYNIIVESICDGTVQLEKLDIYTKQFLALLL